MVLDNLDLPVHAARSRLNGHSRFNLSDRFQLNRINGTSSPQSSLSASGRVAAVGPYIQVPSADTYAVPVDPVKPQSLTIAPNSTHGRSKSGEYLCDVY